MENKQWPPQGKIEKKGQKAPRLAPAPKAGPSSSDRPPTPTPKAEKSQGA